MRAKKKKEIEDVIFQLMLENKINNEIANSMTDQIDDRLQNQKCFVYIEIVNTRPMISYVFNSSDRIMIGRDLANTTICIQDEKVSRIQAALFVNQDYLYIQNCSKSLPIRIKRGLKNIWMGHKEYNYVKHSDKIKIGNVVFRAYLFKGKQWIIN